MDKLNHEQAAAVANQARAEGKSIKQVVIERGLISAEEFGKLISPHNVMRLGHPLTKRHS